MPDYALAVFTDDSAIWFLRFLKRGFRHCFVLINADGVWVSVDPLACVSYLRGERQAYPRCPTIFYCDAVAALPLFVTRFSLPFTQKYKQGDLIMGSLSSRPKVTPVHIPTTSTSAISASPSTPVEADPLEIAKTRAENILRKNRGIVGTVLTSFRGLLGGSGAAQIQRKTLLGE